MCCLQQYVFLAVEGTLYFQSDKFRFKINFLMLWSWWWTSILHLIHLWATQLVVRVTLPTEWANQSTVLFLGVPKVLPGLTGYALPPMLPGSVACFAPSWQRTEHFQREAPRHLWEELQLSTMGVQITKLLILTCKVKSRTQPSNSQHSHLLVCTVCKVRPHQ